MLKRIFIHPEQNRVRLPWRMTLFLVLTIGISTGLNMIVKIFGGAPDNPTLSIVVRGMIVIGMAQLAVWAARKYLDHRDMLSLGLQWNRAARIDIAGGFGISILMQLMLYLILWRGGFLTEISFGWSEAQFGPIFGSILWLFGIGLAVAWSEEIVFRGYLLQNLAEGIGMVWAVLLMCTLYGVGHMGNPNASLLSGMMLVLLGFVRIYAYLRTRALWLGMGMHAGWNFTMGPLLGFEVSGTENESFLHHTLAGPDWLTGGSFGPEASVLILIAIPFGLGFIHLFTLQTRK